MPTTMLRMTPYRALVRMIMLAFQPIRRPTMSIMMVFTSASLFLVSHGSPETEDRRQRRHRGLRRGHRLECRRRVDVDMNSTTDADTDPAPGIDETAARTMTPTYLHG